MLAWKIVPHPGRVSLVGDLRIADAPAIWETLARDAARSGPRLELDLTHATAIDGAVMSLLVDLRAELAARGVRAELVNVPEPLRPLVHLYHGDDRPHPAPPPPRRDNPIAWLGGAVAGLGMHIRRVPEFAGELVASLASVVRHPGISGRHVAGLVARAGTDGIPIVLLLNFLIGFVMAYQSTRQLESYGANLYVADVVGISVARELGPLITAVIIAGRSGAAYAAELGTMRVSDEIDALRTMGFVPMSYLVIPRIIALVIAAPLLALLGDVAGVLGGLVVGATSLDVVPHAYINELRDSVVASDVWTGLVKSAAFGGAIAMIGCRRGLSATGAASGVGRATTSTVVSCLFALVLIDTSFTVLFRSFDL